MKRLTDGLGDEGRLGIATDRPETRHHAHIFDGGKLDFVPTNLPTCAESKPKLEGRSVALIGRDFLRR